MKIIIPIASSDAKMLSQFYLTINHFDKNENHECIIVHSAVAKAYADSLFRKIKDKFGKISIHQFDKKPAEGWPNGPNCYFQYTIEHLLKIKNKDPWLWMETDIIPIKNNWCDLLEAEYKERGKPFMGVIEESRVGTKARGPGPWFFIGYHLAGTAVYPHNINEFCKDWDKLDIAQGAFDMLLQWPIVAEGNAAHTPNIIHAFRTTNYKIENGKISSRPDRVRHFDFSKRIPDENTILVHGCKDGSLASLIIKNKIKF